VPETKKAEPRKGSRASTRRQNPAGMNEAEEILADIRALWRDLFRNPFDEAKESGLTGPQVNVIACLVTRGPMTLTDLSRTLGMSHSTASGIVDRLQERGLLQRNEDATDRRRTLIGITESVSRYVRQLEAGPAGRLVAALDKAKPGQRRLITTGLKTLRTLLNRPKEST
jgi:MarR family transcriptional regulator, organic hydroperoxide resistance regulator